MIYLQASGGGIFSNVTFLIAIVVVFFFFILRPQMKKQKEQDKFSSSIEKGMEVVTNSGIIGKINKIEGKRITIETAGKTYIQVLNTAISKELTDALNVKKDEDSK